MGSVKNRRLDDWLKSHALDLDDLSNWGVRASNFGLTIPVYSPSGRHAFNIHRSFVQMPRYTYSPRHCRPSVLLYGMRKAASTIFSTGTAIAVEGPADVIALHKHEVREAVGLMTSSISYAQLATLDILASRIIILFDGDEGGLEQARRFDLYKKTSAKVLAAAIKDHDPASFIASGGVANRLANRLELECINGTFSTLILDSNLELVEGIGWATDDTE